MRDIEFRAWCTKEKVMCAVVMDEAAYSIFENENSATFIADRVISSMLVFEWPNLYIPMQCTGLRDKNDVLIYEGDILKRKWIFNFLGEYEHMEEVRVINFGTYDDDDGVLGFFLEAREARQGEVPTIFWESFHSRLSKEYEVIGNMYENPELSITRK